MKKILLYFIGGIILIGLIKAQVNYQKNHWSADMMVTSIVWNGKDKSGNDLGYTEEFYTLDYKIKLPTMTFPEPHGTVGDTAWMCLDKNTGEIKSPLFTKSSMIRISSRSFATEFNRLSHRNKIGNLDTFLIVCENRHAQ